jgi:hypothetical protein
VNGSLEVEGRVMTGTESARVLYARTRKERFALDGFNVDNQETLIPSP